MVNINLDGTLPVELYGPLLTSTYAGTAMTPNRQNPVLEVEIPYQTQGRFLNPRVVNSTVKANDKAFSLGGYMCSYEEGTALYVQCAAAEDFSLHFFIGAPVFVNVNA